MKVASFVCKGSNRRESLTMMWGFFCVYMLWLILYSVKTNQIDEFWRIINFNHEIEHLNWSVLLGKASPNSYFKSNLAPT